MTELPAGTERLGPGTLEQSEVKYCRSVVWLVCEAGTDHI